MIGSTPRKPQEAWPWHPHYGSGTKGAAPQDCVSWRPLLFGEAHTWDTADRFAGVAGASVKSVLASEHNLLLWMTILGGPRRFWSREGLFPSGASFLKTLALLQTSGPDTRGTNAFQTDCSKSLQELRLLAYHVKELLA